MREMNAGNPTLNSRCPPSRETREPFLRTEFRRLNELDFGKIADDWVGWFGGERWVSGTKYQAGLQPRGTSRIQFGDHITEEQDFVWRYAELAGNSLITGRLAFGPGCGVVMTTEE